MSEMSPLQLQLLPARIPRISYNKLKYKIRDLFVPEYNNNSPVADLRAYFSHANINFLNSHSSRRAKHIDCKSLLYLSRMHCVIRCTYGYWYFFIEAVEVEVIKSCHFHFVNFFYLGI